MSNGRKRPVKCVETGQVFESMSAAAEWVGLSCGNVSDAARGVTETAGGYHWMYTDDEPTDQPKRSRADKPKSTPNMTIEEVQAEAERRTRETGRYTRYADIQKEETIALMKNQTTLHKPKKKRRAKG